MIYEQALPIARKLIELLEPACKPGYCRIAGSLRRLKPDVGDIEIVAVPDLTPARPMFGRPYHSTRLEMLLTSMELDDEQDLKLYRCMGGDKFKQFWISIDRGLTWCIKLDLFLVTPPADWGVIFLIRSGPSDFSHWIISRQSIGGGMPDGYHVEGGQILTVDNQHYIPCPEEIDFFKFCGMEFIEPRARCPIWRRTTPKRAPGHILQVH